MEQYYLLQLKAREGMNVSLPLTGAILSVGLKEPFEIVLRSKKTKVRREVTFRMTFEKETPYRLVEQIPHCFEIVNLHQEAIVTTLAR